jgi:hypothetical protein
MFSTQRITRVTAIALTAGAVAAPVATARPARMAPNAGLAAVSVSQQHQLQAATAPAVAPHAYTRQDKQVTVSSRSQGPLNNSPASAQTATSGSGFDWGDAGIGAAGGLAISVVGIGGAFALSQRRSRRTRPTAVTAS